jgi:hypothetical protein
LPSASFPLTIGKYFHPEKVNTKGTTKKVKQPYTKNFKKMDPQKKTQIKKKKNERQTEKLNILLNAVAISVNSAPDWLSL